MYSSWRVALSRMAEAVPEARYEALLALLRASLCLAGALSLMMASSAASTLTAPIVVNLVVGMVSLGVAVPLARVGDAERARWWGRISTVADVVVYATYSFMFHDRPGAGATYGAFVLLMGPVRYGVRGVPATVAPVALIAALWPQQSVSGTTVAVKEIVALCVIFAVPAIVMRAVIMRGGARLRQAEQQFATAFEHASIGMALTDTDLNVLQANRSLGVLLGETPQHLHGRPLDEAVDALERETLGAALRGLSPSAPSARLEVRLRRPDGALRWGHVSASLLGGQGSLAPRVVVQVENITERKRSEAMLSHAAGHDALTDLPNRTLLISQLDAALQHGEQVGVLFLDLDRFKVVNDGLGHAAGDQLLVLVANRLREIMRPGDIVARQGGDEFVVLCRQADDEVAATVGRRVLEVLTEPLTMSHGTEVVVGASIGVALAGPGDSADVVLRDADTAMYAAKGAGGGRVRFFTPDLRAAVVQLHELEVELRAAVRTDRLALVYQPIVDLHRGTVTGCEALVRWDHPVRGLIPPMDFIEIAEQSDLIVELGEWVLRRALRDAAGWVGVDGGAAPTVSVNVSLRQMLSLGFAAGVAKTLAEYGVEPGRLCLEVTETALAGDVEQVISSLEALRDVGVRLSIDDFGTGHASLTYLARFPVDQVKVDRSFVSGLGADAGSAAIVGGVIAMAHTFDLRVVAEGVETEGQLNILRELGADAVQGYLLSRPVPEAQLGMALPASVEQALVPRPRDHRRVPTPLEPAADEARRYRLLVDGAKQVTGRLDLQAVFDNAFAVLGRHVPFTGGSIMLIEDDQVRIAAAQPPPTQEALAARIPLGQGVSGSIAMSGEPRYLPDITIASTVTARRRGAAASSGVRSWYGVPLIAEGRPIGVLQLDSTEVDAFTEDHRLSVMAFAPVVALAVVTANRSAAQLEQIRGGQHPS